jgi:hypothetical protein
MGTTTTLPALPLRLPAPPLVLPEKKTFDTFRFVLGHKDREMDEIETILKERKLDYCFATHAGIRVTPRNCYQADPVKILPGTTTVFVECEPVMFEGAGGLIRYIDHHRKGDQGFEKPPENYWEASSIGQLYATLKMENPSEFHLVVAARDHCRFDAEKGLCPGAPPEKVKELGRKYLAEELGVPMPVLLGAIKRMQRVIRAAPRLPLGSRTVADLRNIRVPKVYCLRHMAIYEALADLGEAAIIRTKNEPGDDDKIVLLGNLKPETVRHFMATWAPAHGLGEIYGCEVRGYAGGYYKDVEMKGAKAA